MAFIASDDTGLTALDTIMAQQANVIGPQVYRDTLHVTPWLDLFPQSGFPENQGYQLTTLIYDRSIPTKDTAGSNAGVKWANLAVLQSGNRTFGTSTKEGEQPLDSATNQTAGPFGGDDDADGSITTTTPARSFGSPRS